MSNIELQKKDLIDISWWNMSPKVFEFVNETKWWVDTIKNRKNVLFSDLENLEKFSDFDWYVEHRQILLEKLNKFFEPELEGETDDFKHYFGKSSSWKFSLDLYSKNTIEKFNRLLVKKNLLLKELTLKTLENWNYNNYLSEEELHDLQIILKSKIFDNFDRIYFKLEENISKYKKNYEDENWKLNYEGELVYWWVWKDWFIPYKSLLKNIEEFDFSEIKQDYLREYFQKFQEIFLSWTTSYDKWLELAQLEMKSWEDIDSKIWIVGSMEDYDFAKVLIDPELEIFIKKPLKEYAEKSSELSFKYFWDKYKMVKTKYSNVDSFSSSWVVSFKQVLWKNFHNDSKITSEFWKYWYSIDSRMKENSHKINKIEKIFWRKLIISNDEFSNSSITHTWQHEFWHNLFKNDDNVEYTKSSLLEENKANLFSLLYTYDNIIDRELSSDEIQKNIEYLFWDEVRRFENLDSPDMYQYILSAKLQIQKMFDNEVISWGDDWFIKISTDEESFKNFYEDMKYILFIINDIYISSNIEVEEGMIKDIEENFEENLQKIVDLLRK